MPRPFNPLHRVRGATRKKHADDDGIEVEDKHRDDGPRFLPPTPEERQLVALENIEEGGLFKRLFDQVQRFFSNLISNFTS